MRKKLVFKIPTNEQNKFLIGEVSYQMGGMNYFSGNRNERGYYFSVTPETHEGSIVSFMMFSGIKSLLLAANRFNQKVLDNIQVPEELKSKLIAHVLEKEKIALATV